MSGNGQHAGDKRKRVSGARRVPRALALGDCRNHAGVLIMCDQGKEQRAMHEVADLINTYLEEHPEAAAAAAAQGGEEGGSGGEEEDGGGGSDTASGEARPSGSGTKLPAPGGSGGGYANIAEELAAEVAELGGHATGRRRGEGMGGGGPSVPPRHVPLGTKFAKKRARFMELGFRGLGLVWMSDGSWEGGSHGALAAVHDALDAALSTHTSATRYVTRLLPMQRIVSANCEEMVAALRSVLAAVEGERGGGGGSGSGAPTPPLPKTYRFDLRARNNSGFNKTATVTSVYAFMAGAGWRRDESSGRLVVSLEVFKTYAGVSVLAAADWDKYHKYNIRVCAETEGDRAARIARARDADTAHALAEAAAEAVAEAAAVEAAGAAAVATMSGAQAWVPGQPPAKRARGEEAPRPPPAAVAPTVTVTHDALAALFIIDTDGGAVQERARGKGGEEEEGENEEGEEGRRAYLSYRILPRGGVGGEGAAVLAIDHTFVPPAHRGGGLASALCDAALGWARAQGAGVLPLCTYVRDVHAQRAVGGGGWAWGEGGVLLPTPTAVSGV